MTNPQDPRSGCKDQGCLAEAQPEAETIPPEELSPEELSPVQAARLIQKFQVYQVELESQNEELRQAQVQLAESRDKYAELYDFAPVGYLALNERGRRDGILFLPWISLLFPG